MAGLNNNHISSITITDGDKPTSVGEASRSEDQEGPVIVSSLLNLMHEHILNSSKKLTGRSSRRFISQKPKDPVRM